MVRVFSSPTSCHHFSMRLASNWPRGGGDFREAERGFPVFEGDAEILGERRLVFVDPDLFDRLSDDLHQLVLIDETSEGCDQQGDRDSGDHNSQVFQVVQEGLLLIRVGLIPELEHFGEKKHVAGS